MPPTATLPDRRFSRALEVVGADRPVPLANGEHVPYVNLDYAASPPCLTAARAAVDDALPWYASVHRGAGHASRISTERYEAARESIRRFVEAPDGHTVVFTRNTTDATNLLAHALPRPTTVLVYETEHHASLLPWRGRQVVRLPAPETPEQAVHGLDTALRRCPVGPRLVAVTGASNVTGELWPVAELAEVAHSHGARIAVDAAQLAPHRPISMRALDLDYVALSGHKLYAPFGSGALVGRTDWLHAAPPYLVGGGATKLVRDDVVLWNDPPARHEAGTPNVLGAVAFGAACDALADGLADLAEAEGLLLARMRRGLAALPGVRELSLWDPDHPRIGVVAFTVDGWEARALAAALAGGYGVGVRDGAFCAHPFLRRLTAGGTPQAVRASIGVGVTDAHVDRFLAAMGELTAVRRP